MFDCNNNNNNNSIYYYTFIDMVNYKYLDVNKSLDVIDKPMFVLSSNLDIDMLKLKHPNWFILSTENNMQFKFQNFVRLINPKVAVKIDCDAIIFNYDKLTDIILKSPNESITGNLKGTKHRNWIRGGCNIIKATNLITLIPESSGNPMDVDCWLGEKLPLKKIDIQIFEQSRKYSGVLPVWHPEQKSIFKWPDFQKEVERWKTINKI